MATPTNVVAVIDDDVGVLESVKVLLSTCGYDAELYASSDAFLAAVSSTAAICLIVDIQIADSDGIELVSQLKAAGFNFPTIFMTGSAHGIVQRRAEKVGSVALLRKPFSADLLTEALVRARTRKRNLGRKVPAILTSVEQGGIWRVRIAWSNSRVHYFGKFNCEKDAIAWITTHAWLARPFTENKIGGDLPNENL